MNGVRWTPFFLGYGRALGGGFSMARQMSDARAGLLARRTAVDSTWAAVTPNVRRMESRRVIRIDGSIAPTGNSRKATIVWMNVESVMSTKIESDRQPPVVTMAATATRAILRFTVVSNR